MGLSIPAFLPAPLPLRQAALRRTSISVRGPTVVKFCLKLTICFMLVLGAAQVAFSAEKAVNPGPDQGPLHAYVKQADNSFKWEKRQEGKVGKATWVELILTSQHWKDTLWKHQLFVIKPSEVENPGQASC